jgi:hypothetical protein
MEADEYYRILGRESIDIIKTGGEKVSALRSRMCFVVIQASSIAR